MAQDLKIEELRTLAKVAVAGASGDFAGVEQAVRGGKYDNVPAEKMYEAILHLVTHAGYPKTVNAMRSFHKVFPDYIQQRDGGKPRALESWAEFAPLIWPERGRTIYHNHWKGDAGRKTLEELDQICPEISHWVVPDAYGRIYGRPGLSLAERETVVSFIVSTQGTPKELALHFQGLLDSGITKEMIIDMIQHLKGLASEESINDALQVVKSL